MSDFLVFSCYRAKMLSAEFCHLPGRVPSALSLHPSSFSALMCSLCEPMLHTPYSSRHLPVSDSEREDGQWKGLGQKKSRELGWDLCSTILVNSLQDRIKTRQLLLSCLGSGWNLFSWVSGIWTGKKLIAHSGTLWHRNYRNETRLHIEQDRHY